ncbi:MAG: hypothetical protein WBC04_04305 [Candidatus Acidiferrales bacterium]
MSWVATEEAVPADAEELEEHVEAVVDDVDFRSWVVGPAHGDFDADKAVTAGEEEQFGIEAEALTALLFEGDPGTIAAECFEAALGVVEGQADEQADEAIENDSGDFAHAGLVDGDEAAVDGARTNRYIRLVEGREKLVRLLDGSGKIGIGEQGDVTTRFEHAVAHAVAFAAVAAVRNQAQARKFRLPILNDAGGGIGRAVVHDNHFRGIRIPAAGREVIMDSSERAWQARSFVVSGNDDGKLGLS